VAAALFVALAACVLPGSTRVRANGVPQLVKLTYLDGVSNFGPKDAEGVLEFSFAEAYVRVDVKNLVPQGGMTFESWMVAPGGKSLYVGDLPVNAAGIGSYEGKLANLTSYDYNLFVVTVRPAGTPAGAIPDKKAIAGRFVVIGSNETTKTGDVRPGLLPDTGERPARGLSSRAVATLLVAAIAAAVAFATIRLVRRGGTHD
jgi:hypothetical protein